MGAVVWCCSSDGPGEKVNMQGTTGAVGTNGRTQLSEKATSNGVASDMKDDGPSDAKGSLAAPTERPIELPKSLPSMQREKSVWVLGDKRAAARVRENYEFVKRLGSPGQFGEAWLAKRRDTKQNVAVKRIAKARFMTDKKRAAKYLAAFHREIQIMKRLDHRYCIRFYEAFEDSNYLYMSMELCTGGELFDRIVEKKTHNEAEAARTLRMLFDGLAYLHRHGLAHFDLKPDNFLFLNASQDSPIKIIDYGMAKPVPPHEYHRSFCGTPYYVAPEVILRHGYTASADLWSMGVIMFLMLYGYPPFHSRSRGGGKAESHREIFKKIAAGFNPVTKSGYGPWFPSHVTLSAKAKDLIASLLEMDPSKRITAEETLAHPWFSAAESSQDSLDPRVLASLRGFRRRSKFKDMLLNALVAHVDAKDQALLSRTLASVDEDADGFISVEELQKAFGGTLCEGEIREIVRAADVKGDDVISKEELTMVFMDRKVSASTERLWKAFTKLDKEGNMKLSLDELKAGLRSARGIIYTEKEIETQFREADLDGDGQIDFDEFLYAWGSNRAPPRPASLAYRILSSSKDARSAALSKTTSEVLSKP